MISWREPQATWALRYCWKSANERGLVKGIADPRGYGPMSSRRSSRMRALRLWRLVWRVEAIKGWRGLKEQLGYLRPGGFGHENMKTMEGTANGNVKEIGSRAGINPVNIGYDNY